MTKTLKDLIKYLWIDKQLMQQHGYPFNYGGLTFLKASFGFDEGEIYIITTRKFVVKITIKDGEGIPAIYRTITQKIIGRELTQDELNYPLLGNEIKTLVEFVQAQEKVKELAKTPLDPEILNLIFND